MTNHFFHSATVFSIRFQHSATMARFSVLAVLLCMRTLATAQVNDEDLENKGVPLAVFNQEKISRLIINM